MNDEEKSLLIDYGEIVVDALLDEGLLRDIPYLGTFYTLSCTLVTLRDRLFAAKIRRFLSRAVELTAEEKKKLEEKISKNPGRKAALTEIILFSLEKADRLKKAELFGVLFCAYVQGKISEPEFDRLTHAINQAELHTLFGFLSILKKDKNHNPTSIRIGYESLISAGITRGNGVASGDRSGTFTRATTLGLKLYEILQNEKFEAVDVSEKVPISQNNPNVSSSTS
jgi:hypothetical protein